MVSNHCVCVQSQKLNLQFPPIEHYVTFRKFVLIQILTDALTNESLGLWLFSLGMHDIKSKYNGHKFMHTKLKRRKYMVKRSHHWNTVNGKRETSSLFHTI
jgi:hypothetical protein